MVLELLAKKALPEGGKYIGIGEALVNAAIGFCVVFVGIAVLVFCVWLVGKILQSTQKKPNVKAQPTKKEQSSATADTDGAITDETVAVITAAIAAVYQKENRSPDFTVRRIKRI